MAGDRRSVWGSSSVWVWGTGCQGPGLACCPGTPLPLASEPETPSQASSANPRVSRRAPDGPQLLAPGRWPSRHTPSPPRAPPQDPHHCRLLSPWAGALARLVGPACPHPPARTHCFRGRGPSPCLNIQTCRFFKAEPPGGTPPALTLPALPRWASPYRSGRGPQPGRLPAASVPGPAWPRCCPEAGRPGLGPLWPVDEVPIRPRG